MEISEVGLPHLNTRNQLLEDQNAKQQQKIHQLKQKLRNIHAAMKNVRNISDELSQESSDKQ